MSKICMMDNIHTMCVNIQLHTHTNGCHTKINVELLLCPLMLTVVKLTMKVIGG